MSHGIPSTSAHTPGAPAMTTMGALYEALTNAKREVAPYPDPNSLVADTRDGRGGDGDNRRSGGQARTGRKGGATCRMLAPIRTPTGLPPSLPFTKTRLRDAVLLLTPMRFFFIFF